jgi:glycosyltransferase involved in cell wall biosynthesis
MSSESSETVVAGSTRQRLSIIVPCYCEEENLPILHDRIVRALEGRDFDWELLLVDDHSPDGTFGAARNLVLKDSRVRVFRLARNSGSHVAELCGLDVARGDAAVIMAADLQDPPEVLPELVAQWRQGDQVVWACRGERVDVGLTGRASSAAYNKLVSAMLTDYRLPPQGADFFLLDRIVIDSLKQCRELRPNILALVLWLGFRQGTISYKKDARLHGTSGWTFRRKVRLLIDSVTGFSHFPLRMMSVAGFVTASAGFLYALYIAISYFITPSIVQGWASLMVVVLVLSGMQMMMLGVMGEYLWRTLEESRRRPRYSIERALDRSVGASPPGGN